MKCLEGYTVERVKGMSTEEVRKLWDKVVDEKHIMDARHTLINMLDVIEAKKSMIES